MMTWTCSGCGRTSTSFSANQKKKGAGRRCKSCVGGHQNMKTSREGATPRLPPHLTRMCSSYLVPIPAADPLPAAAEEYKRQQVELERIINGVDALLTNEVRAGEVGHLVDLIASALPPPGIACQDDDDEWEEVTERSRLRHPLEWAQNPHGGQKDLEFQPSHQLQAGSPVFFEDVAGTLVLATWDLDNIDKWDVTRLVALGGVESEVAAVTPQLLMGEQCEAHLSPAGPRGRFLAHTTAEALGLSSSSDGEGNRRHVVLHGPQHPSVLPVTQATTVSSIAAGRDAVLLLRELLTQLQVGQTCVYFGGSRQIPVGTMGIIDAWRQVLPQKMRDFWEQRCVAEGCAETTALCGSSHSAPAPALSQRCVAEEGQTTSNTTQAAPSTDSTMGTMNRCVVIMKSGKNKGGACGRKRPCGYHEKK